MESVDNNQFEVVPTQKRKIGQACSNVYLNPALDLLANEDPMCNTAMEIVPNKKRKRSKSCDVAFENSALDIGISKAAVNEFLVKELENVRKNVRYCSEPVTVGAEININVFDQKTEVFTTKIKTSQPKNNLSEPNLEHLDIDITFNELPKDCSISMETNAQITEPVYANFTENVAVDDDMNTNEVMPESYVCEIIEPSSNDAFTVPQNVEMNTSDSLIESNLDDPLVNTDVELSRNDYITDSGISIMDQKYSTTQNLENNDISSINSTTINTNITNQIFVNKNSNLSLSFLDRLALDSPNLSNQSLIFDDDLNESNIMEIKTITIITKKKRIPSIKRNTNPFLDPNLKDQIDDNIDITENPFLNIDASNNGITTEIEYTEEVANRPIQGPSAPPNQLMPRRLFDTNSTMSTVNETIQQNEYENIDMYRPESPIYENVGEIADSNFNKQSKILGHDVSRFSAIDIMNINKHSHANNSNESNESKKDFKHQILKAFKPKKVFKKFKKSFKGDKNRSVQHNTTLNPYEVPRKMPKEKFVPEESGIENPALNLDTSDIEIEELEDFDDDEEHQYETIKTLRNTRLNMNVTPLRERNVDMDGSQNKTNTPGKKVRFDSTLNREKVITGNSFDYDLQSPGFDSKIDKYHDELENCINEKKVIQQNM